LKKNADMTGCTLNDSVRPPQREGSVIVIEKHILPATGDMALRTDRPKLASMGIVSRVAGKAILWCTFIDPVHVTGFTGDLYMCACQLEHGKVVIELCRPPGCRRMAFYSSCIIDCSARLRT
jgi:hypothetical protein